MSLTFYSGRFSCSVSIKALGQGSNAVVLTPALILFCDTFGDAVTLSIVWLVFALSISASIEKKEVQS